MQRAMLFLGDSFTWGEGLELYCNTPKWIAERGKNNGWMELVNKQDDDGIKFREENRFATIVANHFNRIPLVDNKNGGCLARSIDIAHKFLFNPELYIDAIIVQFSILDRDPLHGNFYCKCNFCQSTEYIRVYSSLDEIIRKKIKNEKLTRAEEFCVNYYESKTKCKIIDSDFLEKFELSKNGWYSNILSNFYYDHIIKWFSNGSRKIYFIDSWDEETSSVIENIHEISRNKIPLIGFDELKYSSWFDWQLTFSHKNISEEFAKTQNRHPTLKQHQYLAKSIIQFLEEMGYE